eukprot:gene3030-44227_t
MLRAAHAPRLPFLWAELNQAPASRSKHPNSATAFHDANRKLSRLPGRAMGITAAVRVLPSGGRMLYRKEPTKGAAQPSIYGGAFVESVADGAWCRSHAATIHVPGGRPLLVLFFIDGTSGGRIGKTQLCPGYAAVANIAGGLAAEGWHFVGLVPFSEDTVLHKKDMQQAFHELWHAYRIASSAPLHADGSPHRWVPSFRVIVDLKENQSITAHNYQHNVQQCCHRCVKRTRDVYESARDEQYSAKRMRMSEGDLRSAAACTRASVAHAIVPWFHDFPGLGYGVVLSALFHVLSGMAGHLRDFLLKAAYPKASANAKRVDAHVRDYLETTRGRNGLPEGCTLSTSLGAQELQTMMRLLPIALLGLDPIISGT